MVSVIEGFQWCPLWRGSTVIALINYLLLIIPDRQSSGVLERLERERDDVIFQEMIANVTISDNTVNNISPILTTDSLGSLSTMLVTNTL